MRLTDITIRALPPPPKGAKVHHDDSLTGFGVRVTSNGIKSFVLTYGANRERVTIGRYPVISLSDARTEAKRMLAERTLGKHRPVRLKMGEALERFFVEKEANNRASTIYIIRGILERRFKHLFNKNLEDITTDDITRITDGLLKSSYPSAANHAFAASRTFFRWCVRRRFIQHSPLEGLERPARVQSRERVLDDRELAAVWAAADATPGHFGIIVKLAILTGQRRGELAALRREWINFGASSTATAYSVTQMTTPSGEPCGMLGGTARTSTIECSLPSSKDGVKTAASSQSFTPAPLAVGGENTGHVAQVAEQLLCNEQVAVSTTVVPSENTDCEVMRGLILPDRAESLSAEVITPAHQCTITIPATISKNRRSHTFPIGTLCSSLLWAAIQHSGGTGYTFPARGKDTPFNSFGKAKAQFDKKVNVLLHNYDSTTTIQPWTLHDLRRTYATNLQRLGVKLEVIEALLNHVSGTRAGITGVYQRHRYEAEMREAVERYEEWFKRTIITES